MTYMSLLGWIGLLILILMVLVWILSLILKNTSIVDIFWGTGFVLVNLASLWLIPDGISLPRWLFSIPVTIWGLRLSLHILLRNAGKGEDFRYKKWREANGKRWWWYSFFQTFVFQGILMWVIAIPISAIHYYSRSASLGWLDYIAILLWLVGFFFEAAGDAQLVQFKKNPENKGKLLRTGVWKYSRHPNYFGDAAQWWAFYLFAASAGAYWTIFSPILMTFLLVRVSGVALLEKTLINQKPGYLEYAEATSAFIPWFPRSPRDQQKES